MRPIVFPKSSEKRVVNFGKNYYNKTMRIARLTQFKIFAAKAHENRFKKQ